MTGGPSREPRFATTRWSVVVAAGAADPAAHEALAILCRTYWYPLYAYARRRGNSREDAADLVQGFFAALLEKGWAADADPERGRFRAFLLTAFRRFCTKERTRQATLKRGGGRAVLSLDFTAGETRYEAEGAAGLEPERAFERRWALTLLASALERTRREFEVGGRADLFEALVPFLGGPGDERPYAEVATRLAMTEGAVKVAALRLRNRYQKAIRDEIRDTVSDDAAVDDEIRHLMDALAAG